MRLLRAREGAPPLARARVRGVSLDDDPAFREKLYELTGGWTVPQITIGDEVIGGYSELWRLDRSGHLEEKLAA